MSSRPATYGKSGRSNFQPLIQPPPAKKLTKSSDLLKTNEARIAMVRGYTTPSFIPSVNTSSFNNSSRPPNPFQSGASIASSMVRRPPSPTRVPLSSNSNTPSNNNSSLRGTTNTGNLAKNNKKAKRVNGSSEDEVDSKIDFAKKSEASKAKKTGRRDADSNDETDKDFQLPSSKAGAGKNTRTMRSNTSNAKPSAKQKSEQMEIENSTEDEKEELKTPAKQPSKPPKSDDVVHNSFVESMGDFVQSMTKAQSSLVKAKNAKTPEEQARYFTKAARNTQKAVNAHDETDSDDDPNFDEDISQSGTKSSNNNTNASSTAAKNGKRDHSLISLSPLPVVSSNKKSKLSSNTEKKSKASNYFQDRYGKKADPQSPVPTGKSSTTHIDLTMSQDKYGLRDWRIDWVDLFSQSRKYSQPSFAKPSDKRFLLYPETACDAVTVINSDVARLRPGNLLNDVVVDFWMRIQQETLTEQQRSQFLFLISYFYDSMGQEKIRRWTRRLTRTIFEYDFIFMPINKSLHWKLAVICNLHYFREHGKPKPVPPGEPKKEGDCEGNEAGEESKAKQGTESEKGANANEREMDVENKKSHEPPTPLIEEEKDDVTLEADSPPSELDTGLSAILPTLFEKRADQVEAMEVEKKVGGDDSVGNQVMDIENNEETTSDLSGMRDRTATKGAASGANRVTGSKATEIDLCTQQPASMNYSSNSNLQQSLVSSYFSGSNSNFNSTSSANPDETTAVPSKSLFSESESEDIEAMKAILFGKSATTANQSGASTKLDIEDSDEEADLYKDVKNMPCILVLDSLGSTYDTTVFTNIRSYLNGEWLASQPHLEPITFTKKNLPQYFVKVPEQDNGSDCGLFVLLFMEYFMKQPPHNKLNLKSNIRQLFGPKWFPAKEEDKLRKKIKKKLHNLKNKNDEYDDSVSEECYERAHFSSSEPSILSSRSKPVVLSKKSLQLTPTKSGTMDKFLTSPNASKTVSDNNKSSTTENDYRAKLSSLEIKKKPASEKEKSEDGAMDLGLASKYNDDDLPPLETEMVDVHGPVSLRLEESHEIEREDRVAAKLLPIAPHDHAKHNNKTNAISASNIEHNPSDNNHNATSHDISASGNNASLSQEELSPLLVSPTSPPMPLASTTAPNILIELTDDSQSIPSSATASEAAKKSANLVEKQQTKRLLGRKKNESENKEVTAKDLFEKHDQSLTPESDVAKKEREKREKDKNRAVEKAPPKSGRSAKNSNSNKPQVIELDASQEMTGANVLGATEKIAEAPQQIQPTTRLKFTQGGVKHQTRLAGKPLAAANGATIVIADEASEDVEKENVRQPPPRSRSGKLQLTDDEPLDLPDDKKTNEG